MISEISKPSDPLSEKTVKAIVASDPVVEADPLNYLHAIKLNGNNFFSEKEGKETVDIVPEVEAPQQKPSLFFKGLREKLRFSKIQKLGVLGLLCGWVGMTHWWGQSTPNSSVQDALVTLKVTPLAKTLEINQKFSEQSKIQSPKNGESLRTQAESSLQKAEVQKIGESLPSVPTPTEIPLMEYKVVKGDSLYKIALEKLGSTHYVEELARYNQLDASYKIRVGQILKIPSGFPKNQSTSVPPTILGEDYCVMEGDSLYKIAERKLGSRQYAREIAEYNQLKDPSRIRVGQILKIPEKSVLKTEKTKEETKTTPP